MEINIIVAIYSARKQGDKTKSGPESFDTFNAAVGVSGLSTRPEGPTVSTFLPDGWIADREVDSVAGPYRKLVKIELPNDVEDGPYTIGGAPVYGLHSTTHAATDGMGRTVYAYCRDTRLLLDGETWEHAIDSAINSGVVLLVPGEDGKRHEVPAKVLAVSDIYGANAPEF